MTSEHKKLKPLKESIAVRKSKFCGCGAELIKDVVGMEYCGNTLCKNK